MKVTINMTDTDMDLDRYAGPEDLRSFLKANRLDGLEFMPCMGTVLPEGWKKEDVVGIHLMYYHCWLDFWKGNAEALDREYGTRENWQMFYNGGTREGFLEIWRKQLKLAHEIGAKYVVFHVAECSLEECLTYEPRHTDREVCQAACEIINQLLDGTNYNFYFLVENLWWSGLNLRDNDVTRQMLEGIRYPHKGIMLDTGHLLNTNLELRTQEEGVRYIHQVLDYMGELTHYIKGIHLNMSLSGAYVKDVIAHPPVLTGDYWKRLSDLCPHIYTIDHHEPFTADTVGTILQRLGPEFVTFEYITQTREQHGAFLREQWKILDN